MWKPIDGRVPGSPVVRVLLGFILWFVGVLVGGVVFNTATSFLLFAPITLALLGFAVYFVYDGIQRGRGVRPSRREPTRDRSPLASGTSAGDADTVADAADPFRVVQERYARGEMDDEEFERRLSNLVESEDARSGPSEPGREPAVERT